MEVIAIGCNILPVAEESHAVIISPTIVVRVVMSMGLRRVAPAVMRAVRFSTPSAVSLSASSTNIMPLFTTTPISIISPSTATTDIPTPVMNSIKRLPVKARGMVNIMINGVLSEPNCAAITRYTSTMAMPSTMYRVLYISSTSAVCSTNSICKSWLEELYASISAFISSPTREEEAPSFRHTVMGEYRFPSFLSMETIPSSVFKLPSGLNESAVSSSESFMLPLCVPPR